MKKNNSVLAVDSKNTLTHEARVSMIANDILRGLSKNDILDKYEKLWQLNIQVINGLWKGAMSFLYNQSKATTESVKQMNLERLEAIMDNGNTSTKDLLKAIDLSNKTAGVYTERIEVKSNDTIHFEFPDVEANLEAEQAEQDAELQFEEQ